jgi:hypothetical protein
VKRRPIEDVAKMVIVTSAAYYGLDESLIPDHEFDGYCQRLHDEWEDLSRVTQWKLGDPQSIHASGYHVKLAERDVAGLAEVLFQRGSLRYRIVAPYNFPPPNVDPEFKFKWTEATDVRWDMRNPIS